MDVRTLMQHLGHGVFSVDAGYVRPRFDAVHLVVESDRAAVIDTGTRDAVPRTLAALQALGIAPAQVGNTFGARLGCCPVASVGAAGALDVATTLACAGVVVSLSR